MKTIEILSKGRKVQFTTKSVTIDGQEYLYSHITELRHSEAKRVYGFKCDGEVIMLPYEAKDEQVLKVIFSQVRQMHRKPAKTDVAKAGAAKAAEAPAVKPAGEAPAEDTVGEAPAADTAGKAAAEGAAVEAPEVTEIPVEAPAVAEIPVEQPAAGELPAEAPATEVPAEIPAGAETIPAGAVTIPTETETIPAEVPTEIGTEEPPVEVPAEPSAEELPETKIPEEAPAETSDDETPTAETPELTPKERKRLEKEQRKAAKEAAKREKREKKAGGTVTYADSASGQTDPAVKSGRFRKAIIIFIVIVAVFALLGIAYYFLIGPASDPQIGPNTTDQTQYNDIDDMINDLEN